FDSAFFLVDTDSLDKSTYSHLVSEIKHLLVGREFVPIKVSRGQNRVADRMANYGRIECTTACWLQDCPSCIAELLLADGNSASIE
uniref:RNase H type-1 domain-containing protein n=1 Tax=Aegilops tauschii subsp. strangulata TaxID=200361 RepID=A0A453GM97_AEGTS